MCSFGHSGILVKHVQCLQPCLLAPDAIEPSWRWCTCSLQLQIWITGLALGSWLLLMPLQLAMPTA